MAAPGSGVTQGSTPAAEKETIVHCHEEYFRSLGMCSFGRSAFCQQFTLAHANAQQSNPARCWAMIRNIKAGPFPAARAGNEAAARRAERDP
jgi:hypothetical protein